ncbi:hypothetical protein ABPG73_008110, partial [Tetrahymena malaccensis]
YNSIKKDGAISLGSFLGQCSNLQYLELLIGWNEINYQGAIGLVYALSKCKKLSTFVYDLGENQLREDMIIYLSTALGQITSLTKLDLKIYESKIGNKAISDIFNFLEDSINLTTLNLSLQWDTEYRGLSDFYQKFAKCSNLQYLRLNLDLFIMREYQIADEIDLASILKNFTQLKFLEINLGKNKIKKDSYPNFRSLTIKAKRLVKIIISFSKEQ